MKKFLLVLALCSLGYAEPTPYVTPSVVLNGEERVPDANEIRIVQNQKAVWIFKSNGEVVFEGRVIDVDKEFVALMKDFLIKAAKNR